jgi:opacity protein-like surface antigen
VNEKNTTKITQKYTKTSKGVIWLTVLSLIFVEPLGAILWFKFFKRPHDAAKAIISVVWFFIWVLVVAGMIAAIMGYEAPASTEKTSHAQVKKAAASVRIGQAVSESGFEFTVNSIKCGETQIKTSGDVYFYSDAQGQFCRLNVTITNTSNSVNSIDADAQYVYNDKGQQYSYDSSATSSAASYSLGNPLDDDINPGNSVTGDFVFDVPVGATLAKAELHASRGSKGVKISLR